jgi:diacylglycerol kinase (ATP)
LNNFHTALLIINRHARRGKKHYAEVSNYLQQLKLEVIEISSAEPERLPDLIRQHESKVDLVIIGGGDGTLNAAVAGLVDTQLPLAILPLGTANDLARTLSIPSNPVLACQLIETGQLHAIDLGWVNDKYFFNVASLGLSTNITRNLTNQTKRRWGSLAYGIAALRTAQGFAPFNAEIRYQQQSIQVRTLQIAIGNGKYYGGGMTITEGAAIDDQQLDLYSLEVEDRWRLLYLLPTMIWGQHTKLPCVRLLHGQSFEVYTDQPRAINTDGELTTYTPAKFRLVSQAIKVIVPPNSVNHSTVATQEQAL